MMVYQDFLGTWNPADASVTLASTGHGEFDFEDNLAVPFLLPWRQRPEDAAAWRSSAARSPPAASRTTRIGQLDFPVAAFLTTPTEALGSQVHPAVLPDFPQAPGAYALIAGSWQPLPRNNPGIW